MEKISSFKKDHNNMLPGLDLSGTDSGGVATFDLRFVRPNSGRYLANAAIHTIEHIMATLVRSRGGDDIVYFGPMGCRTGFYLLTRNMDYSEVKDLLIWAAERAQEFEEVPGNLPVECGNYREHDLIDAKRELKEYSEVLKKL